MSPAFVAAIGETDCETIGEGLLRQPVNALSSLAFVVFGIAIVVLARGAEGGERTHRFVFGALLVATGIGSVLYHGPQTGPSHFLHDVTFAAAIVYLVAVDAGSALSITPTVIVRTVGVAVAAIALLLLVAPAATNVVTTVLLVALVVSDVIVRRNRGVNRGWYATALVLAGLAVVSLLLGRTDAPLCDPDSALQFHGVWHGLSAAALFAYFMATVPARHVEVAA